MENHLKQVDFIHMYHLYSEYYLPKIKLHYKRKLLDTEKKDILKVYLDSKFLSEKIAIKLGAKVNKTNIYDYEYRLIFNQGVVGFHFISQKSITSITKLIRYYFFIVFLRINYVNKNKVLNFMNNVYIYLITVPIAKKLSIPISVDDVNSACTQVYNEYYGGPGYIWREDELAKVLLPEALHSVHYDWEIINQALIPELKNLETNISRENGLNANESYNELGATFFMSLFSLKAKPEDKRKEKRLIREYMLKELDYSFDNCAKILLKYGVRDSNDCNNLKTVEKCDYRQEASAYSYILLKGGLLWYILYKIKYDKKHEDRVNCLEQFMSIGFWGKMGASFQRILVQILKDKAFNKIINKRIKKMKAVKRRGRPEDFFFTYHGWKGKGKID